MYLIVRIFKKYKIKKDYILAINSLVRLIFTVLNVLTKILI